MDASAKFAAIFDLDGVIVSTDKYHREAWKRLADRLGLPFTEAQAQATRGIDRMSSLRVVLGDKWDAFSDAEHTAFATEKNDLYKELIRQITPGDALPGAVALVRDLAARGVPRAIGSASKNALPVLERLGIADLFDAVVTGYDFTRGKPAPDVFLVAAERLGAAPDRCIVFEDAAAGIAAARAGGMKCVGIGDPEIVRGCDLFAATPAEIAIDDLFALAAR